jgi:hypothetical protein
MDLASRVVVRKTLLWKSVVCHVNPIDVSIAPGPLPVQDC